MKSKKINILILLAIAIFLFLNSIMIVNQTEQVIVLQFGKPIRVVKDAGLHFKTPFIQNKVVFDNRLLDLIVNDKEVITQDQKRLIVNAFAKFKIVEPINFYNAFKGSTRTKGVFNQLNNMLESSLRQIVGSSNFSDLLSTKRSTIMQDIENQLNTRVKQYGIEIIDTRIMRADLPKANSSAVFKRMQTERELEAKEIRAEGEEMAKKIIADTDKTRMVMIAEANKKANILMGEGEAKRADIFNKSFSKDVNFYEFIKTMQLYKNTINKENTTIITNSNTQLYKNFGL